MSDPASVEDDGLLIHGARLVCDERIVEDGWVLVRDGVIAQLGSSEPLPGAARSHDARGALLAPGFVDIHSHGGGGHSGEDGETGVRGMAQFHRRHGTTSIVVSLATGPLDLVHERLRVIADVARSDDRVLGSHAEGPFLAHAHRGAHEESLLRTPTPNLADGLLAAAGGTMRQITLAPELTDEQMIDRFLAAGVRVAVGHTAATQDETAHALRRGASILTHAFNGMPGIHHRAPGPIVAALQSGATLEVIADGVHVDPSVIALLFTIAPERIALVTDAIAAAGAADGQYPLGGHTVTVRDGVARIGAHGSLAGSTLTLDRAVRVCVAAGVPLPLAVRAATRTPARAIGELRRGVLEVGARADLIELDDALQVRSVWTRGQLEHAAPATR